MLTSVPEHMASRSTRATATSSSPTPRASAASRRSCEFATLAAHAGLDLAPHYAMEIHLHLAATYPTEPWVEHFEWLNPLFNERIDIRDGGGCGCRTAPASASRSAIGCGRSPRRRQGSTYLVMTTRNRPAVVAGLKDKILAGDLPPGHKLPSEVRAHRGVRRSPHRGARGA